ncbi:D-alanyl-lipoteichoic acid acyltransferase DltB, MBOAT superfamily [Mucilaginibacter gossypiicola]|uniref:D-alanyl-lipoteichoic acid acyltransferase DltB, MBOAT superfamily n=1 Tax=Mucilaginibacter gossypiicola TaxID=551995 RepID=A0A1H8GTH4_9SPHI|nr:MBOAT family O-acyltransferase [Mucilaginibacter gossypiicola]SEN46787.1 D-alanyl-lipoteichoic acid acyltransferase DltB, MBOAT superfamily [Mucilaginibacter gossypiicola]
MLFNSFGFGIFLIVVFALYWFVFNRKLQQQNLLLMAASYFFYACWDWRFLFLLIFSTLLDYFTGLKMYQAKNQKLKTFWLWLSITINLGFLGVFKYYNFFASSLAAVCADIGIHLSPFTLNVILPVGISFYTFHGLSYVIDVYKGRIKAERNFIDYSLFVSFFPLLVAGPIERSTHLLPQVKATRKFNYQEAINGLRQMLWGLFKKAVIADQCADYANLIFANSAHYTGSTLVLGAIFFAFQIYCDFSGYSDMALGIAKLFGFDLLRNFAFPYFSRDMAEFWRRWHISLSSWFRDYLYIPLGGSKTGTWLKVRNTLVIFIVSGFWHGANWTFIIWGFLNALFILPSILLKTNRNHLEIVAKGNALPTPREFMQMVFTFIQVLFAWIFFRADSVTQAFKYIGGIFSKSLFSVPQLDVGKEQLLEVILLIITFIIVEWQGRENQYAIEKLTWLRRRGYRLAFYYTLIIVIFLFTGKEQQFIYFQF